MGSSWPNIENGHVEITADSETQTLQISSPLTFSFTGVGSNEDIPLSYMKSENFTLESRVTIDCNDSKVFSSSWSLHTGYYYNESSAALTGVLGDMKRLKIMLKSKTLQYGMYRFCSKVVMVIDDRFQREECGYVEIIASPLVATVAGGDKLTIPLEELVSIYFIMMSKTMIRECLSRFYSCVSLEI